ncbi:MAG: hypothetical protein M3043_07610 [Lysinibacillus fusiformis]|nr:hypothetical protein [Lysinibacillus fusiformis]MCT6927442.1 hypothetical protein [Lysinibacillus fusiformis]MCT6931778.1 hypothetical protein [Lysinibacillus fusiformis]
MNRSYFEFPNTTDLAAYHLTGQTLYFNTLSKLHFEELIQQFKKNKFEVSTMKSASLIVHEAAHYFDNLATLSGQQILLKNYNALNELNSANNSSLIDYYNTLSYWKHLHYMPKKLRKINDSDNRKWSYNIDSGIALDAFGNFTGQVFLRSIFKYDKQFLCNVPFSIEALWETNAMWAEIAYQVLTLISCDDESTKIVGISELHRDLKKYIYNSELLVYSSAAHFVSSFLNYSDIYKAFIVSKALATISLNLPLKYYSKIKPTNQTIFREIPAAILKFDKSLNPTVIYLILLENLVNSKVDFWLNGDQIDINKILKASNLPNKVILNQEIIKEMDNLNVKDPNGDYSELYNQNKEKGIFLFSKFGIEGMLNCHPASLLDVALYSDACVFGEDMVATAAYNRHDKFRDLKKIMDQKLSLIKV